MKETITSPLPQKIHPPKGMDFPSALKHVIEGKKIHRLSWPKGEYGVLLDGFLRINKLNGIFKWSINDGDLYSKDWKIYEA